MGSRAARRLLAAFLLGVTVGAAATVPYYGRRIEALLLTTGSLLQQLHEHQARLERLEQAGDAPVEQVIQRVRLEFLYPDDVVRLALAERLAPLADELVGRELERVDPYLIYALFDGRAVDLEDARYRVMVRSVIAAGEVTVILAVERLGPVAIMGAAARPAALPDQCDPPGWPDASLYGLFTEQEAPWAGSPAARERLDPLRRAAGAAHWLAGFRVTIPEPLFAETANVRRAAELLAGTVVEPGAVFSLNAAAGPYTRARGYGLGPTYVGGRLVPGEGGGVCKIATALYNVVIHGGLTVVERHAHSMIVPYVAPGRDAAVAYGAKDLRFRNDTAAPVVIWSEVRDLTLFVALYGGHEPPQVTWHHEVLARQEPWTLRPFNPELGPGQERVVHEGFPGFTVRTWLTVTHPGRAPEHRDLGIDTYQPLPRVVEHGP